LDPAQRAAVRAAGRIGLPLVSAGASLVWGLLAAALVAIVLRAAVIDLFDDVDWGLRVVAWIEALDATGLAPLVLVVVLAAVAAAAVGCWLSARRMRRAGIASAVRVTLRGAALGTALQAVLSTVSSWLLGLLVLLTGVVGAWFVAALWLLGWLAASALIGWLAGPRTWLAIARREVRRDAAGTADRSPGAPPTP
ncbi:hypothetical protein NWP09_13165, partial [Agrococcus sp. HG114]|nr:hypothetical protein [Agrococcus sp. HG114]